MRSAVADLADRPPRGRPKKGELRPPKLPTRPGRGRPNKAEAEARAAAKLELDRKHAGEVIERERQRALSAKRQRKAQRAAQAKQRSRLKRVGGTIPDDPLEAAARLCRLMVHTAELALEDVNLTPSQQRAELRAIGRSVQGLIPASRMLEAERVLRLAIEKMSSSGSSPTTTTPLPSPGPMQMPRRNG